MYYRHDMDYQYPERCDEHMITVKHLRDVNVDKDYPYLQKSFWFKCQRVIFFIVLRVLMFWLIRITHGLRIYGRENLKKHKEVLKNGAITISNHICMWDFVLVSKAVRPRLMFFPAWKTNLEGPNGPLIRMAGGIPIPTESFSAMKQFRGAMEEVLEGKTWMHFFPEGSMWFYYPDIRPLKKAVFQYAVKYDRPIVPIVMTFRKRRGITKWFTKKPQVDLHIGEPMFHDKTLDARKAAQQMHEEAYHVMQIMAGVNPGDPTYNVDQTPSHYQKTM